MVGKFIITWEGTDLRTVNHKCCFEYINFNFSGSSYSVRREMMEQNYPDYQKIFSEDFIDTKKFNQYVEQKMNDNVFIADVFKVFEK